MKRKRNILALIFALASTLSLYLLHHLPVNQLFIDPFSEAIKNHDIMDVGFSKFRDTESTDLFDDRIFILNSGKTNRQEIAEVINFLKLHEVGAIGVDLLFEDLQNDSIDLLLKSALDDERVVLGYTFDEKYKKGSLSEMGITSHASFLSDKGSEGYVNLATNDGFSVRAFEPFHTIGGSEKISFAGSIASIINQDVKKSLKKRHNELEWINFRRLQPGKINMVHPINESGSIHYSISSISNFLADSASYDSKFIKDKIFLIGFNGEDEKSFSMHDRYFTPLNETYHGRSLPDMHGVVVHANIISMLLDSDYIDEIPESILYLAAFLMFFLNYFIFLRVEKKHFFATIPVVRVIQLIQFLILFSFCIIMITHFNIKVGFILVITAVILSFEFFEFYEHKIKGMIEKLFKKKNKQVQTENI